MDEETLAPLADALSATLAVFILLICFFVMSQVSVVSKQIKIEKIGDSKNVEFSIELEFESVSISNDEIRYFNSFDSEKEKDKLNSYFIDFKERCGCKKVELISNFPALKNSPKRAKRKALINAIKIANFATNAGLDYEINLVGGYNYHFVKIKKIN